MGLHFEADSVVHCRFFDDLKGSLSWEGIFLNSSGILRESSNEINAINKFKAYTSSRT